MELNHFVDVSLDKMDDVKERSVRLAGLVTEVFEGVTQKGLGYKKYTLQDFKGSKQFGLYNEQFKNFGNLVTLGAVLYVEGMILQSKGSATARYCRKAAYEKYHLESTYRRYHRKTNHRTE